MLHSSDPDKNFRMQQFTNDYKTYHISGYGLTQFYLKNKLSDSGFIFPDGSLKFEFFVKKHNNEKRLQIAQIKIMGLEIEVQRLKKENA